MDIRYTVASCQQADFAIQADVLGATRTVMVPGLVLEMVSTDGGMGHTFRVMPTDLTSALAQFPVGKGVTVTLTPDA